MKDILLILVLQLIYVPVYTLRTILLVKNMGTIAAFLGFLEALIYVFGLSIVFSGEQSIVQMIVYAVGFGLGIMIGSSIERKLAIGFTNFVVKLVNHNQELIDKLRYEGFGVTLFVGRGRDGERYQLDILTKRSREEELFELIEEYEPRAFIISYEPSKFKGGYLVKAMKKRMKKKLIQEKTES